MTESVKNDGMCAASSCPFSCTEGGPDTREDKLNSIRLPYHDRTDRLEGRFWGFYIVKAFKS